MSRYFTGFLAALALLGFTSQANATVVFSGTSNGLSASASFTISGSQLTILLTNTDAAANSGAPDRLQEVLSGLYFNLGTSTFTPSSAVLFAGPNSGVNTAGAIIQEENCNVACAGLTNIGGEWSYAAGGASWLTGTTQGISSTGYLNANTGSGNFNGSNLDNLAALGGIDFGIVPKGWAEGTGNYDLDKEALIEGTAQFVLNIGSGKSESDIKNVYFTYGTAASQNTVGATKNGAPTTSTTTNTNGNLPEPAMLTVLGMALAGLALHLSRRKQSLN